jgi:hypothetical protein
VDKVLIVVGVDSFGESASKIYQNGTRPSKWLNIMLSATLMGINFSNNLINYAKFITSPLKKGLCISDSVFHKK